MNKIELLNYWLNLTKFDENQTSFKIFSKDWKFNENNKKMIKVALEESWIVAPTLFKSKCKISPYKGMKLKGVIIND